MNKTIILLSVQGFICVQG